MAQETQTGALYQTRGVGWGGRRHRQEYWSGLPCSSPGDLPNPGIEPRSPALAGRFFITELSGKPKPWGHGSEETDK